MVVLENNQSVAKVQSNLCMKDIDVAGTPDVKEQDGPVSNPDNSQKTTWCSKAGWKLIAIAAILSPFQYLVGCTLVFSSPFIDELTLNRNSTPWDEGFQSCFYQTLIGPSGVIGAGLGGVLSSALISMFGLVVPMVGTAALYALSWGMIGASWFVPSPIAFRYLFLTGRLLTGIAVGLAASIRPVYLGEISPDHMRTVLIAISSVIYASGAMVTYLLGAFLHYWTIALLSAATAVVLIPCIACLPESPIRTMNCITNIQKAASNVKTLPSKNPLKNKTKLGPFLRRLAMSEFIVAVQAVLGYVVIVQYLGPILNVAGASKWNVPHGATQALTIGLAEVVGALIGMMAIKKIGHVTSCVIASVSVCLGHTVTGVFFSLTEAVDKEPFFPLGTNSSGMSYNNASTSCFFKPSIDPVIGELYSPIAFLGMGFTVFFYGVFWVPRQYNIILDLFPDEMRGIGIGIFITSMFTSYTITSALFPILESVIGTAAMFYTLATASALSAILIPTLIPETMGTPKGQQGDQFTPRENWTRIIASVKEPCLVCCRKFMLDKVQINKTIELQ